MKLISLKDKFDDTHQCCAGATFLAKGHTTYHNDNNSYIIATAKYNEYYSILDKNFFLRATLVNIPRVCAADLTLPLIRDIF